MAEIQEHKSALAKYVSKINSAALDGMIKTYSIVLNNKDAEYVACSDNEERKTVRENFLKKKLGLTQSDEELDATIETVCNTMQNDRFKSRLVFYYLLADKYNKLDMFA